MCTWRGARLLMHASSGPPTAACGATLYDPGCEENPGYKCWGCLGGQSQGLGEVYYHEV